VNHRGTLTYRGDRYRARLNLHAYELANITDVTPYDRLPQITLDGKLPFNPGGLDFTYGTEYVRFDRNLRSGNFINKEGIEEQSWYDTRIRGLARANGERLHIEPGISLPLDWSWGFLKPQVKYMQTRYDISLDQQGKNTLLAEQNYKGTQNRGVGLFSVDSG